MPEKYRGTTIRSIRVPEVRWRRAAERAREEGTTLSEELNAYLEAYGTGEPASTRVRYG